MGELTGSAQPQLQGPESPALNQALRTKQKLEGNRAMSLGSRANAPTRQITGTSLPREWGKQWQKKALALPPSSLPIRAPLSVATFPDLKTTRETYVTTTATAGALGSTNLHQSTIKTVLHNAGLHSEALDPP